MIEQERAVVAEAVNALGEAERPLDWGLALGAGNHTGTRFGSFVR